MANRVYIDIIGTDIMFSAVCTEDINVQAVSQFSKISDLVPGMTELANMVSTAQSVLSNQISKGIANIQNALDIPIWLKTEPVKIPIDLNFYIKSSGYMDVWRPTMVLQSMCVLSKKQGSNSLITPGFNINSIGNAGKTVTSSDIKAMKGKAESSDINSSALWNEEKDFPTTFPSTSKLCSLYIPGIVYVPIAIIESIQVTWSKQLSSKGYPIWSKVNCQFTGAYPAVFEDNFLSVNPMTASSIPSQDKVVENNNSTAPYLR